MECITTVNNNGIEEQHSDNINAANENNKDRLIEQERRILSGMRPSGKLHLGHLHGVLNTWKSLQQEYRCFFFVADWHALTTNYDYPQAIPEFIDDMTLDWLSIGIDPDISTIFVQSHIKEHAELNLIFSMITPVSWLERNPTYKEQQEELRQKDLATHGFLGYPVLQAADILIYKANKVPVGVDQLPHLELTREIARRFNYLYGETFPIPEPLLAQTPKVPGIDGRKMSKSYGNAIFISDSEEEVVRKVSEMITDTERKRKNDPGDPEKRCIAFNLHKLYIDKDRLCEIVEDCKGAKIGCVQCKRELADAINSFLTPIRERRREIEASKGTIKDILIKGRDVAREFSEATINEVKSALWGV